jgi:hypothetical protein
MKPLPATLHPRALSAVRQYDGEGNPLADAAIDALSTGMEGAYASLSRVVRLREALQADSTTAPAAKALRLRDAALKAGEQAAAAIDRARERALGELRRVQAETIPAAPASDALSAEIRAALRGADDRQRARMIDQAVRAGDGATIGAVLAGPAYLSGGVAHDVVARAWRAQHHPAELDRIERVTTALQQLELGSSGMLSWVESAASDADALAAERAQAGVREAEAALAGGAA